MRFTIRMQLISPISLFRISPSIGASLFYLELSSLRIYRLSYLDRGGHISGTKPLAYPMVLYPILSRLSRDCPRHALR